MSNRKTIGRDAAAGVAAGQGKVAQSGAASINNMAKGSTLADSAWFLVEALRRKRGLLGFVGRRERTLKATAANMIEALCNERAKDAEAVLHTRVALYLICKNYKVLPIGLAKGKSMSEIEAMSVATADKVISMLVSGDGPVNMDTAMAGYLAGCGELKRRLEVDALEVWG